MGDTRTASAVECSYGGGTYTRVMWADVMKDYIRRTGWAIYRLSGPRKAIWQSRARWPFCWPRRSA